MNNDTAVLRELIKFYEDRKAKIDRELARLREELHGREGGSER